MSDDTPNYTAPDPYPKETKDEFIAREIAEKDSRAMDFKNWLAHGENRVKALFYVRNVARLVAERVATDPPPRYHRKQKKLSVWMFVVNDKGEKVLTPKGSSKVKVTVKVSSPPPWVQ